jgi:hypothetical protein
MSYTPCTLDFGPYYVLKGMFFSWGLFRKVFPPDIPPNYVKKEKNESAERKKESKSPIQVLK